MACDVVLQPRLDGGGGRGGGVERKGGESSDEAVSGVGGFGDANQTRELLQISEISVCEPSFRQGHLIALFFYRIYLCIYMYFTSPESCFTKKMTFKMAEVKNVLTETRNG